MLRGYSRYKISWKWICGPHHEPKLTRSEAYALLSQGGAFVRNTYDFDCKEETEWWYVIKDTFDGMKDVPSKYRGYMRKSIEKYEFKIVSKNYAIEECYETHKAAAGSYRVKAKIPTRERFEAHVLALDDSSYDIWVCIDKDSGRVAGFAFNHVVDDMCDYESMKFHPDFLKPVSPSYGLIYKMNEYYLANKGLSYVSDGARSITEHSEIQSFIVTKYHFRKAYCHVQMFYKWWFRIIVMALYPFRRVIRNTSVRAILKMEEIARVSS